MNVNGYEVPKEVEQACIFAMLNKFKARDIEQSAIGAGAPKYIMVGFFQELCAYRIADRLIQRERKAGRIVRDGQFWVTNKY